MGRGDSVREIPAVPTRCGGPSLPTGLLLLRVLHAQPSRSYVRRERSRCMKVHVALNTPRFDESVRFYRTFLGLEPVKLKPGYAKFDVAEPGLNLTLNASPDRGVGALNHLGIQVQSTAAVRE